MFNAKARQTEVRQFDTARGRECFFALEADAGLDFAESVASLLSRYDGLQSDLGIGPDSEVMLRFHLSDVTNQAQHLQQVLKRRDGDGFCSVLGQPPASGSKIAMEAYHIKPHAALIINRLGEDTIEVLHGDYRSLWVAGRPSVQDTSYRQTHDLFGSLAARLGEKGGKLENETIRTWIYVRDVDNNYQGLVDARRELFELVGLVRGTHYIASTGIEGTAERVHDLVLMDSLSVIGLEAEQIQYLSALDYLCPTHEYNVTFERGTKVQFGDRAHYYISGTASIDSQGNVLHVGDIVRQSKRTLVNIEALLSSRGADIDDLQTITVYLRDPAEYGLVKEFLAANLPADLPYIIVKGSVCRPLWLIEIEGIAATTQSDSRFKAFC